MSRLQRIQNVAARILTGTPKSDHITPVLSSLHWLPIDQRIKFKIITLVHKALHGLGPGYIRELLTAYHPHRTLRSGDKNLLVVPFTRSNMVQQRAFSLVGPRLWNDLPLSLRSVSNYPQFKNQLKTFLFSSCYNK